LDSPNDRRHREVAINPTSAAATVLDEVGTWAGITTKPTSRGATAILFEGHELGHVHANRGTLDLPLLTARRAQVFEAGRAKEWFSGCAGAACSARKKLAVTCADAARLGPVFRNDP